MSKRYTAPLLFGICCLSIAYGDASGEISALAPSAIEPVEITSSAIPEPFFVQPVVEHTPAVAVIERPFTPFTGKIKGRKVRLRATADLEGRVVKELNRQDLLVIVGEKGDFYSVEPPAGSKAYVFRSFVLDGIVEGKERQYKMAKRKPSK